MDDERRIRFLVAPVLFLASLALGVVLDQGWRSYVIAGVQQLLDEPILGLIVAFVSGGIAVFASGLVIGTITHIILRGLFALLACLRGRGARQHEIVLSEDALKNISEKLGVSESAPYVEQLFIGVTFDHDILQKNREGVHNWLKRRWNAFNVNCSSITALILSLILGWSVGIPLSAIWYITVIVAALMFLVTANWAWRDTMGMLTFQASLPHQNEKVTSPAAELPPD